jgi:hypothetical protein
MLETKAGSGWMVSNSLSQADIMTVITFQSASRGQLSDYVNVRALPRLGELVARATSLDPFASTLV